MGGTIIRRPTHLTDSFQKSDYAKEPDFIMKPYFLAFRNALNRIPQ
jgi:hypothetical protein